jgi:hypothetical protein
MSSFLIKKNDEEKDIIVLNLDNIGYDFRPKMTGTDHEINKITVFNSSMIDIILTKKIEKQFKRVAAIVYDILNSDDENSDSDIAIALDEVSKIRNIILNKYQKFLDKESEKMYLKKLRVLENQLRTKIVLKYSDVEEIEEEKGHRR